MIVLHEKTLWHHDQDKLAGLLANKTPDEIYDILEDYNYILVKKSAVTSTSLQRLGRVCTIPLIPALLLLGCVKWMFTGDRYLDSWFKKVGFREWAKKWMF